MYLSPPSLIMVVIPGRIDGLTFIIDDLYQKVELDERIRLIVAPKKKGGDYRFKTYDNFTPGVKERTNKKGRPVTKGKKPKYRDTLRTCIAFYITSLDPNEPKDHFYTIKLFITGKINTTGITKIDFLSENKFEPSLIESFAYFEKYISNIVNKECKLSIDDTRFDNLNFRSFLVTEDTFDKSSIYKHLSVKYGTYPSTTKGALKKYIKEFLTTGKKIDSVLLKPKKRNIKFTYNTLHYLLNNIDIEKINIIRDNTSSILYNLVFNEFLNRVLEEVLIALSSQDEGLISNISSTNRSKGGVGFSIKLPTLERRKVNIYNSSYNSYCKSYTEALYVHKVIHNMIKNNSRDFLSNKTEIKMILF